MYDFSRCKLCGENSAAPKYKLKKTTLYACASCDFHFIDALDDSPPEQPEERLLTDRHRRFIEGKLPQNQSQLATDLQFVQRHIDLAGKKCLDIGTGVGLFAAMLKEAGGEVQAIEPQQIFREFASEKYRLQPRPELIDAAYWQTGFADHFDLVTLWDTIEHVNFPVETLQAACNVLKPGGYLFLDTPSRDSLFYRSSEWSYRFSCGTRPMLLNSLYSPQPYCHKQIFTRKQLWTLLQSIGFTILEQSKLHHASRKLVLACRKEAA